MSLQVSICSPDRRRSKYQTSFQITAIINRTRTPIAVNTIHPTSTATTQQGSARAMQTTGVPRAVTTAAPM